MTKEKVTITYKLCEQLMDDLACLCYSVTGDIEGSELYAKRTFMGILGEWEDLNGFEFDIVDNRELN
jgi:hypothetical protein